MKRINLEQGSEQWLAWRRTVITATEASIILGNNPWDTMYQTWQRKLQLIDEKESNQAMERGKLLEPEARAQFNERYNMLMEPTCVESTEYDFLGASLDGITEDNKYILEIKCGGPKLYSDAEKGVIPQYYKDQMQHQLLVTGAEKCYYYCYDGTDGICIQVMPDPDFEKKFLPKARAFWKCVAFETPPEMQPKDYIDKSSDPFLSIDIQEYKSICSNIKDLEEEKDLLRKKILDQCGDRSTVCNGAKVMKTTVQGKIDYDAIPELANVDLSKYRKEATVCWKILTS